MKYFFIVLVFLLFILLILFLLSLYIHNKIFGKRFTPDPLIKYYTKEEYGLNTQKIEVKYKKYHLRGYIYSNNNCNDDYLLIYCHGMFSCKEAYMQDIGYLCQAGFQVLGFDYFGVNESEGKNIIGFSQSLKSLDIMINHVTSLDEYKNKKLYVIGHSWGGFASINIPKYRNVDGVIALAPFCSVGSVLYGFLKMPLKLLIPFLYLVELFKVGFYALDNAYKSLKKYNGKVLIIHSKDDSIINYYNNAYKIQNKIKKDNIKFLIVDGKNHNPNYSDNAVKLLGDYASKVSSLHGDELIKYKKDANYHAMGELDNKIMDKIVDFILK